MVVGVVASCLGWSTSALAVEVIPIENSGPGEGFGPIALSESGNVLGGVPCPGGAGGYCFGRWRSGVVTQLKPLPGDASVKAYDIDDQGVIVGSSYHLNASPSDASFDHAVKWAPNSDTPVDIGPSWSSGDHPESRGSVAEAITPNGAIFGMAASDDRDLSTRPVRFNGPGSVTNLWEPPGPANSLCGGERAIDLFGVSPDGAQALVTGSRDDICPGDPLLVTAGSAASLASCITDFKWGIGNGSTVVGQGADHMPVRWKAGTCAHLAVPDGTFSGGQAYRINSHGVAIGTTADANGGHGVIWSADGTFGFIDHLLSENSPWHIQSAWDITADGWILAAGTANGQYKFVILKPMPAQLLPDIDQEVPSKLSTYSKGTGSHKRFRIAFRSAVDNVGPASLLINGHRQSTAQRDMTADQVGLRSDGSKRTYPDVGALRFSKPSWPLRSFDHYELRQAGDYELVSGRRAGFCLRDGYDSDPKHRLVGEPGTARLTANGGRNKPGLLQLSEGISVGYGVAYHSSRKGEFVDVTALPAGQYYLVHRANEKREIRESDYTNNASSLLVRLRWPGGTDHKPSVSVLRKCPNAGRCPG